MLFVCHNKRIELACPQINLADKQVLFDKFNSPLFSFFFLVLSFHKAKQMVVSTLEKASKNWQKATDVMETSNNKKKRGHYKKVKLVKITFRPDRIKISERKCISEHPFGTIKRTMNEGYFLLQGKKKVVGEVALMCLGYNMIVAKNLLGFDKLMEVMAA
ncbi:MAG: hypothetical protein FWE27_06535 [Defluviitaleaceae bacterium]|nr:hypothetical protein [Defluviitaleaceae bacterium]